MQQIINWHGFENYNKTRTGYVLIKGLNGEIHTACYQITEEDKQDCWRDGNRTYTFNQYPYWAEIEVK